MLQSISESLIPVLLMILLGTALRNFHFMPEIFFAGLNKLAFYVGLPCVLFLEIARTRADYTLAINISLTVLLSALVCGVVAFVLAKIMGMAAPTLRSFVQGALRGNVAYVGIPIIYYALGDDPEARSVGMLALATITPVFNVASILILLGASSDKDAVPPARRLLQGVGAICTNPLIIACVLGLIALKLKIDLPPVLNRTVQGVGALGLPSALLALGATLSLERAKGHKLNSLLSSVIKVGLAPLIAYCIAFRFGLSGSALLLALLFAATPTAVTSYVMADQMGADRELASAIIVISTVMAFPALMVVLTLFG